MSENSSNSHLAGIRHKSDVVHHVLKQGKQSKKARYRWSMMIGLPLWVAASFIFAQLLVGILISAIHALRIPIIGTTSAATAETVIASIVYILSLSVVIGVPYLIKKRRTNLKLLGLEGLPTWTDIGLSPLGFIAYALLWSVVSYLVVTIIPAFPMDQGQEIGFHALGRQYEYTLAFLTLVVIAPIAEETLFRGYLYGKLRNYVPVIPAILTTSLLFGFAHLFAVNQLQWNVALDTFLLSIILCLLRVITGSIWAGILLHMIKNGIAFFYIFGGAMFLMM